ncbi:Cell division protein FtsH [Serinicoccus hydrothermalis]|uniref:Cell division protein FtsH n=1 Tax=Serinicoccus hydrothermalis TaxID=1758689 RepID=A0A1B1NBU6_9MICO|nr:ATP-binding protein [Serinicoccus hydrothermalis]ANS78907.1 Cell division protein FtsH [Serinicoccus hydrothermalis]
MDDDVREFLRTFTQAVELSHRAMGAASGEPLADRLTAYLGAPVAEIAVVTEEVMNHRYADWDVALAEVAGRDPESAELGVGGGDMRHHVSLGDLVGGGHGQGVVGQVDYASVAVGPTEHRRAIGLGLRLFRYAGHPVVVMQRRSNRQYGRDTGSLEVICADEDTRAALLDELREVALERSVLRGQVIAFESSGYGPEAQGVTFLPRPEVGEDEVILPPGSLARIAGHVSGIAEHADTLRRHGQHLKRGLLLHGPPGTGKTHTVRHLISRNPGHTVVVLAGESLGYISLAASLARALQPAVVVLEDCDLVAEDRGMGPSGRPLLFEVLDAMDGLDADADVTFLLTTNRAQALERALVQRPGRVDLAVEIPLPDEAGRRRLLELYQGGLDLGDEALAEAARRTEGMTASFVKELVRRAVLAAAMAGEEPGDEHLRSALDGLLAGHEELTRVLLGNARPGDDPEDVPGVTGWEQGGGCGDPYG